MKALGRGGFLSSQFECQTFMNQIYGVGKYVMLFLANFDNYQKTKKHHPQWRIVLSCTYLEYYPFKASAPPTISRISPVMAA